MALSVLGGVKDDASDKRQLPLESPQLSPYVTLFKIILSSIRYSISSILFTSGWVLGGNRFPYGQYSNHADLLVTEFELALLKGREHLFSIHLHLLRKFFEGVDGKVLRYAVVQARLLHLTDTLDELGWGPDEVRGH